MTQRVLPGAAGSRPLREWLTIGDASALAGVSPATLRRWSNAGDIRAFTTPGGHRRFARAAVLGLLTAEDRGRPPRRTLGETTTSIVRAYRRGVCRSTTWPTSVGGLTGDARQPFRECGRAMVVALVDYLDAADGPPGAERRAAAEAATCRYGQVAALNQVPLRDTVELFVRFRAPLLNELGAAARRMELDATATTALLEGATDAIDRLLPSLIAGHESANRFADSADAAGAGR